MSGEQPDGGEWWIFGRSVSSLPSGGTVAGDARRAVRYPQTMTVRTAAAGCVLLLTSFFVVPLALLLGYVAAAARSAAEGEPLPGLDDWDLIVRGVGLVAVFALLLFGPIVVVAMVAVALGQSSASGAIGAVALLFGAYATPWGFAVFGADGWRALLDRTAWRWLGTSHYLKTVVVSAVLSTLAYVALLVSAFTLVGWIFVAFCAPVVLAAFAGQRYRAFETASTTTAGPATDSSAGTVGAAASSSLRSLREAIASPLGDTADTATESVTAAKSGDAAASGEAGTGTGAGTTADEPGDTGSTASESSYAERLSAATAVGSEGALERYAGEDGVRFLALSADHDEPPVRGAFQQGVGRWEGITHNPRVATVHDSGDDPTPWVACDALDGPLSDLGGDLSRAETVAVVADVEGAVSTGRRYNVAHGDVRPACVYVERAGGTATAAERIEATLGEWGIASEVADESGVDGRPVRYLAPEQFGGGAADARVDVYQVAAVAHYALLGEPPFETVGDDRLTDPERDVSWSAPDGVYLPEELAAVFERALATDPDERYESTSAFLRAFRGSVE